MKKRILSLLVCACVLATALSATALAAEGDVIPTLPTEPTLHLGGVALVPTAEGATHTFENGGVVTLTTVGQNEAGGTDFALTLENVRVTQSVRENMGDNIFAAGLHFVNFTGSGEKLFLESKDTLAITLKGSNFIAVQGQADEAVATALVSSCSTSISGDGSLFLMAAPVEGAETVCYGINVMGNLSVGASLNCTAAKGTALALGGEFTFTDGATLRWPTEQVLSEQAGAQRGVGSHVMMNGEAVADQMIVAAPTDPVTRAVAVFNLWKLAGSPAPEGEYPFTDPLVVGDFMEDAIHWAGTTGLAKGYGNGQFGCMDPLTNEQFAVLFCRMLTGHSLEQELPEDYAYADSVSLWAKGDVAACAANGWAPDPKGVLTHSEMDRLVAVLGRMLERKAG